MRSLQKASLVAAAAGLVVTVAAVTVAAAGPQSPAGAAIAAGVDTLPPTETTVPASTIAGDPALTTTLPTLPVPGTAPVDNELEPQTYHGRIQIPAIEVDSPFIEGIRLSTLDYGPGHWPGTAMPGELGNVVVAAHRTSHNADFRRVDELQPGDEVIFDLDDSQGIGDHATVPAPDTSTGRHVYRVAFVEVVNPDAMWIVQQDYRHTATLFACHPPGSVAQRIVVHLDLVDEAGEMVDPPRPSTTTTTVAA